MSEESKPPAGEFTGWFEAQGYPLGTDRDGMAEAFNAGWEYAGFAEAAEPKDEPAKVIVVTDDNGRERRYAADEWQAEEAIDVVREGEVIVTYPQGTWRRATVEGAELDSVRPKALRLQAALRKIAMADDCTADEIIRGIARAELERSGWDEEDL